MIIKTKIVTIFKAVAITCWPFIFVAEDKKEVIDHEEIHLAQQFKALIKGLILWALITPYLVTLGAWIAIILLLPIGIYIWFFLYLFCLPFGWNPWRKRWEFEAFKQGNGFSDAKIEDILKNPPYYLRG
jgi:hypothetical protein